MTPALRESQLAILNAAGRDANRLMTLAQVARLLQTAAHLRIWTNREALFRHRLMKPPEPGCFLGAPTRKGWAVLADAEGGGE